MQVVGDDFRVYLIIDSSLDTNEVKAIVDQKFTGV